MRLWWTSQPERGLLPDSRSVTLDYKKSMSVFLLADNGCMSCFPASPRYQITCGQNSSLSPENNPSAEHALNWYITTGTLIWEGLNIWFLSFQPMHLTVVSHLCNFQPRICVLSVQHLTDFWNSREWWIGREGKFHARLLPRPVQTLVHMWEMQRNANIDSATSMGVHG